MGLKKTEDVMKEIEGLLGRRTSSKDKLRGLKMLEGIPKEIFDSNESLRRALFYLFSIDDGDIFSDNVEDVISKAKSVAAHFDYPTPTDLFRSLSNGGKQEIVEEIQDLLRSISSVAVVRGLNMLEAIPKEIFDSNESLRKDLFYALSDVTGKIRSQAKYLAKQLGYPTPTYLFKSLSNGGKQEIVEEIQDLLIKISFEKVVRGLNMLEAIPKEIFDSNESLRKTLLYLCWHDDKDIIFKAKSVAAAHFGYSQRCLFESLSRPNKKKILSEILRYFNSTLYWIEAALKMLEAIPKEIFDSNESLRRALYSCMSHEDEEISFKAKYLAKQFGYPTPTDLYRTLKKIVRDALVLISKDSNRESVLEKLKGIRDASQEEFDKNDYLKEALFFFNFSLDEVCAKMADTISLYFGYPTPTDLFKSLSSDKKQDVVEEILGLIRSSKSKKVLQGFKMLKAIPKEDFDTNKKLGEAIFYRIFEEDEEISSKAKSLAEDLGHPTPTDLFKSLSEPNKKKIVDRILEDLHDSEYWILKGLRMLKALPEEDFQKNENLRKALFYTIFHENEDVRGEAESLAEYFGYTPETLYNSLQNKQKRDELTKKIMDELSNRLAKERDPENSVAFELLSKLRGILQRARAVDDASTVAHKDFAFGNTQGKGKAKENALKN